MNKKSVVVPALLILVAACLWWSAASRERALASQLEMTQVLVARADLPAKTVLKEELVEPMPIPRRYMQQDAYEVRGMSDIKLTSGLVAAVRIPKGNQITRSCLIAGSGLPPADSGISPAQRHYLEGVRYFQGADYEKARGEWKTARKLDPSNSDAAAGLKRIEDILSGGK